MRECKFVSQTIVVMKRYSNSCFGVLAMALGAIVTLNACSGDSLPRGSAEEFARFEAAGNKVFEDTWNEPCNELHSLMIVKGGRVVYENYAPSHSADELHIMWSVSKTFTATAVGFAVQDGLLSLSDKVVDYFPEELPTEPHEWLQEITLHDLLIMSSGLRYDYIGRASSGQHFDWAKQTLAAPFDFRPGTMYHYNSMNTYLLSVVVSKVTGKKLADYLDEKLFTPLGIEEFIWNESPQGYNAGGWGLHISTESLAKMGQFMLQRGVWNGKQLLYQEWFDEAMSPQIMQYEGRITDPIELEKFKETMVRDQWHQGYGYQMWCCTDGAYRLDGAWSQYCIIFPEHDAVVAATSHAGNGATILNSIWTNILPLFND